MSNYQALISAFDTAKGMNIVDIKLAIGVALDPDMDLDCEVEGDMLWLVKAGLLSTPEKPYTSGNHKYRLTATGHCYALNRRCPLNDSIRRKQW